MRNDALGALAAGRRVFVNAYTDATTGNKVATSITSMTKMGRCGMMECWYNLNLDMVMECFLHGLRLNCLN